jgi:hypothetical protein
MINIFDKPQSLSIEEKFGVLVFTITILITLSIIALPITLISFAIF